MPDIPFRDVVAAVRVPRDVVRVAGPDAAAFLHGQLSQDITSLGAGRAVRSFVLQPTGKVDALVRVQPVTDQEFLIDTDAGWGGHLASRLSRFKLRTKADIEQLEGWELVTVRGPGADDREPWPGLPGYDIVGASVAIPDGVPEVDAGSWESARVEAGIPRMGAELTEATIPAEAGQWLIDQTVSFTKGCFTGQELVARIDSRGGNVPRRLLGVVLTGSAVPPVDAVVRTTDGRNAGALTSAAMSPSLGAPIGLAYVPRSVNAGTEAVVEWDGSQVMARIEELPLVR